MLKTAAIWIAPILAIALLVLGAQFLTAPVPTEQYQQCLHVIVKNHNQKIDCRADETLWQRTTSDPVAYYTFWLTIFTLVLASVGIIQGYLSWQQIRLARDEFISSHRPEIVVREARFDWPTDTKQVVSFVLCNRGRSRCKIVDSRVLVEHHRTEGPVLNARVNGSNDLGTLTLAAGEVRECETAVSGAIAMMKAAADEPSIGLLGAIYLMGCVVYADDGGTLRRTIFCRRYEPTRRRFVLTTDPEYEYSD